MESPVLSPEAMIVQRAMETHRAHLVTHQCPGCLTTYGTMLDAIKLWFVGGLHEKEVETQEEGKSQEEEGPKKEGWKNPF